MTARHPRKADRCGRYPIRATRPSASSGCGCHILCRHSTRRAEQRWPALSKADVITSPTTCSASAEESTNHRILASGFGISGDRPAGQAKGVGKLCLDRRGLPSPGEHHTRGLGCGDQRRTHASVARKKLQRACRDAAYAGCAHLRRRSAAVSSRVWRAPDCRPRARRRSAREDRQREVPRADADDRPSGPWPGPAAALCSIVAQEIDRLAHLGNGVQCHLPALRMISPRSVGMRACISSAGASSRRPVRRRDGRQSGAASAGKAHGAPCVLFRVSVTEPTTSR